jgi:hypothetical protein
MKQILWEIPLMMMDSSPFEFLTQNSTWLDNRSGQGAEANQGVIIAA